MSQRMTVTMWKSIPSITGYEASSDGRVRSIDRNTRHKCGGQMKVKGKELKLNSLISGYVTFRTTGKTNLVSRAVLEAFVGLPSDKKMHACHINGIKTDNRLENLRWDTPKGNAADKRIHGTETYGEKHPQAKLTRAQVEEIKVDARSEREIGAFFGISESHAGSVRRGVFWKK